LNKWSPHFNPWLERINNLVVWVKLQRLSLEIFPEDILKAIGNSIWTFLEVDEKYKTRNTQSISHISVELEVKDRLVEEI